MAFKRLTSALHHPLTQRLRRIARRVAVTCAVILAVAIVSTLSMDVGPALKSQAETQGSRFIQRPMHIGRLGVRLWDGAYLVEDLRIEGLTPESTPFLVAKRITVSMPWRTLFNRRIVFDTIEMTDWRMHVEYSAEGRHNFPKFTRDSPRGPSRWTTTLSYVHAYRGEFTYQDFGTPWGIVARNLDVTVEKPASEYIGKASFADGLVAIQSYVPFRTDMSSTFKIDGGRVLFDRIDLTTEGTRSVLNGDANMAYWPELSMQVKSTIDFPKMRELFFANETFSLMGQSEFNGVFHLFKEPQPNGAPGQTRTGRELKGEFRTSVLGVNQYRFNDLRGDVRWTPEVLWVSDGSTRMYGGAARFGYRMAPLNAKGVTPIAHFDTTYERVDLTTLTNFLELEGIRLAGRASGTNVLEWPLRRYKEHTGNGAIRLTPPDGVNVMTRSLPLERIAARTARGQDAGPFSPHTPYEPVPIGGEITYAYGPEWIDLVPGHVASESTYVEFEGRTKYGGESRIPFHVSSADWQESDRVFAGILTAFGARTRAIPIGGYGTFDGVMTESFARPRIEGEFSGEQMQAWDVVWGSARGSAVIQNSYVDVKDVRITSGDSTIETTGRYSLGFPRRDGGEELNASVQISKRPIADLRHAFAIDDYDVDGTLTGEFHVFGKFLEPLGFGRMEIANAVAYGEPLDTASASVRFEGAGARMENVQVTKGGGRGSGAAYIGWNGTYSFTFDAREIPAESVAAAKGLGMPVSGLLDFTAAGSGSFDAPRYDVRGTLRDLFVADEGIGQVVGDINVNGESMTLRLEAASPRLAVSVAGVIALTPEKDADVTFLVADTSLDPYVRLLLPRLSPYTTAVASGSIRVVGALNDLDHLLVDVKVDRVDMRLFDYALHNARPIRLALDRNAVRISDMRLEGQDTQLDVAGLANLRDETVSVRTSGDANLAVLQGFVPNMRSTGMANLSATFEGPLKDPIVSGTLAINNGRIRHFSLPHALENINGAVGFDSRGVTLDGLTGRLGGGDVKFGGRIDKEGYLPGRLDITMNGRDMRLRFPEGMRSLVDADLALQGTVENATLSGQVTVKDAVYTQAFTTGGGLFDFGADESLSPAGPAQQTLPVRFEIRINAPSTLQVQNREARLVANADLLLRGTLDRPLLFGRVEIERGDAVFEGKRYIVTRGTIDFNNPSRIEPFIDLEAETRVRVPGETYRVTLRVTGPLDRLSRPEFTSDPPLPEVEILALVFSDVTPGGNAEFRQYDTVTPQEQLLRERATRYLTGRVSSEVGRVVEQTIGVDTFQLTPSLLSDPNTQSSRLDPGARVTVGKRLSDRVYLTYSRSLSSATRDQIILLEYDQTDRFSWILSRNEDGTYALDWRVRRTF